MSQGGDLFALSDGAASQPNFEIVFRGYHKEQVDKYVSLLEAENEALAAERENAFDQTQAMAAQVHQLQLEIAEVRRRGNTRIEEVSFRHLGPRVEHILTLAEEQAEAIRHNAVNDIHAQREEAERLLADARGQHASAIRDFEAALAARRAEEERAGGERRNRANAEIVASQEYAARLRTEAEAIHAGTQQEARRLMEATAAQAQQLRTETDAYLQQQRAAVEAELTRLRTEVERQAAAVQAQAEDTARRALEASRTEAEAVVNSARSQGERIVAEARRQATEA
ncbi:MAG TPA: Laminin subunit beta-1, partial [Rugosimonospora sp.]|nr:Laminin subunit beta-1 [Rugosimonospora sp.]